MKSLLLVKNSLDLKQLELELEKPGFRESLVIVIIFFFTFSWFFIKLIKTIRFYVVDKNIYPNKKFNYIIPTLVGREKRNTLTNRNTGVFSNEFLNLVVFYRQDFL